MRLPAAFLLLLAAPAPALAQAYQCTLPAAPPPVPAIVPDGPTRQMPVAGYTLALSWSPQFCRGRESSPTHARQCSGREGRFGFIVHGLWPEGRGETWPQWCPTTRQPDPAAVRRMLCTTPDARLLAHEWAKHGSCMVGTPQTYFRVVRLLYDSLNWPDYDRLARRRDLTAGDVRAVFADANPGWSANSLGLVLGEDGWLRELRLCMGRDFRPARCTPRRFGPADSARVQIWRGL